MWTLLSRHCIAVVLLLHPSLHAQSCPAADSAIGSAKDKAQLKASYDKFADTTTLESKAQPYAFMGANEIMRLSFVARHPGQAPAAMMAALHLKATHEIYGHAQASQMPDRFSDSSVAIVLADSARLSLPGSGHRAKRFQTNVLGPPTIDEDVYFSLPVSQLAAIARARTGGVRIGEFDMPMEKTLAQAAAVTYRTMVCAPGYTPSAGAN